MNTTMNEENNNRTYIAIDLKSYYASVECADRGLNPLTTNLVVADESRTEKTICLAVSPSLKAYGIPGRARLFEVVQKVNEVNSLRRIRLGKGDFTGKSSDANELDSNPSLELSYIVAVPRMKKYMEISSQIYDIYLKYVSPEDIHVYSIDECFIDVTEYLELYKLSPKELCAKMIKDVFDTTGITATGGIGSNMYLCKVAMDIVAKHIEPDANGVRIAQLDEEGYRRQLWTHEPITDFWRVGAGIAKRLREHFIYTMGDVARCSIGLPPSPQKLPISADEPDFKEDKYYNKDLLYKLFGVNAELLIDHAWGYEPTTIDLIKAYKPETNSISTGQVLSGPYEYDKAKIIVREMADLLVLDLVEKGLATDQIVLTMGYDIENTNFTGEYVSDHYGRKVPKPAHGSINIGKYSSSSTLIIDKTMELFDIIINKELSIRRVTLVANHVITEQDAHSVHGYEQLSLFDMLDNDETIEESDNKESQEKNLQLAIIDLKKRFGKNAVLKGTNLQEGATTIERNGQVGGHRG